MLDTLPHLVVLAFLLIILFAMHRLRETVNPLILGVVGGLANHAAANAPAYGMALLFGLSASLSAFYDVFSQVTKSDAALMSWWQLAKILNPAIVASLAYATQSKFKQGNLDTHIAPSP